MDMMEIIKKRKSVRTFDGRGISAKNLLNLRSFLETVSNPYGIPVEFVLLDAEAHGLSSPVIRGEHLYVAAKVPQTAHCEEAFGFSFEQMVLHAWSLGLGATWIGGTMDRSLFERAAGTKANEFMMIASPLGYPAAERSEVDARLRAKVHGDERLAATELFYDKDFDTPLQPEDPLLEAVRWAPSAANMQPWRVVRTDNAYHLYKKSTLVQAAKARWDVQKIDLGIALCHLMAAGGGTFELADPGIAVGNDTEYIATVQIQNR